MVYIRINMKHGWSGIAMLSKYEGTRRNGAYFWIENLIESVWYGDDGFRVNRHQMSKGFSYGRIVLEIGFSDDNLPTIEEISRKEYYSIINELKKRKIVYPIEQPKEPYMVDVVNSTNTCIRCVPKIGFEVGYKKVYTLEWFNSMGAAYPMPHMVPFVNNPYEITVNTKKYKGYRFVPEESTTEKSVYQVVWPRKKEFEKDGFVYR